MYGRCDLGFMPAVWHLEQVLFFTTNFGESIVSERSSVDHFWRSFLPWSRRLNFVSRLAPPAPPESPPPPTTTTSPLAALQKLYDIEGVPVESSI